MIESLSRDTLALLRTAPCVVVTAPPGVGKSTILPLRLLDAYRGQGTIVMLEPRRLAARQIAERMAHTLGEPVGRTVGYRVRFDTRVSEATRIEVVTEGVLARRLTADPTLDGVAVVVFDEYHERSLPSDEALALTREVQRQLRPELRVVVMSATIDTAAICAALQAPLAQSDARQYPVDIVRLGDTPVPDAVRQALHDTDGDILVFLPGQAEILRTAEALATLPVVVRPLYGMLPPAEQRRAITPEPDGARRVVLATPIAETSLTIEGITTVVDAGTCRQPVYNPATGLTTLRTVPISLDMATQRAGRAGRLGPGRCYRLWTLATEHRMATTRTPEILTADLAPLALDLAAFGTQPAELPWVTPPPPAAIAQARGLLEALGALQTNERPNNQTTKRQNDQTTLTPIGRRMAAMPCHPRLAHMLLTATDVPQAALIAAYLEEHPHDNLPTADITPRLRTATRNPRIAQAAEHYRRLVGTRLASERRMARPQEAPALLIAAAYPERIARADGTPGHYRLATGEQGDLPTADPLAASQWLAVAEAHTGRIHLAAPMTQADADALATDYDNIAWNTHEARLTAARERRIGAIVVSAKPLPDIPQAAITAAIANAARHQAPAMFDLASDDLLTLQRRLDTLSAWHPELPMPDTTTQHLVDTIPQWLPLYAPRATTAAALRRIPLAQVLWDTLPYELQRTVDRLAPTHITVPTGSNIKVRYRQGQPVPVVAVRLQECFGMTDTPRLDDGRRPVLLELLSPGYKPVQLTQDLASFWREAYFDVRADLRRRYPKHAWPDNPLEAEPTRRAKKRGT